MARRLEIAGAVLEGHDDRMVRRLRKAPVDRVLCKVTDPDTAREFWDLVQEVLKHEELDRPMSA
jgi:hypothetical protein